MPQTEARAWWADVQHLRETTEPGEAPTRPLALVRDPASDAEGEPARAAARRKPESAVVLPDAPHRRLRAADSPESVDERRLRAAQPRRTVEIRGRLDLPDDLVLTPSLAPRDRDRAARLGSVGPRPDRIAMWAVVLGIFLLLVAALSSDSASAATRLGQRPLKVGMVGRDVRHLQLRLKHAGFFNAPATARFGALTRRGVKRYQRSRCLPADGVAGPATVRALRHRAARCHTAARGPGGNAGQGTGAGAEAGSGAGHLEGQLGSRTLARGMAGRDVRTLQRLLAIPTTGSLDDATAGAVEAFQRGAGLGVDGAVGPATRDALIERQMRPRTATFYGPGLYGRRTACGQRLTPHLHGVAHRSLPCGAAVTLFHDGRFVTARVVDRGPFVKGITFDLTAATARDLGSPGTVRLRAAY
jgi:peptidoglycan hydrolase-like protein with peptidoglycan-binding domain